MMRINPFYQGDGYYAVGTVHGNFYLYEGNDIQGLKTVLGDRHGGAKIRVLARFEGVNYSGRRRLQIAVMDLMRRKKINLEKILE